MNHKPIFSVELSVFLSGCGQVISLSQKDTVRDLTRWPKHDDTSEKMFKSVHAKIAKNFWPGQPLDPVQIIRQITTHHATEGVIMFNGFQLTISFFGASITLARQPDQSNQWNQHPKSEAGPAPSRRSSRSRWPRSKIPRGCTSSSARRKRPGWSR